MGTIPPALERQFIDIEYLLCKLLNVCDPTEPIAESSVDGWKGDSVLDFNIKLLLGVKRRITYVDCASEFKSFIEKLRFEVVDALVNELNTSETDSTSFTKNLAALGFFPTVHVYKLGLALTYTI